MPNKRPPVFPKNAYKSSTLGKRAADHIIGQKSIIKEIAKPQHKVRGVGRVVKMNFVFDDSADYLVLDNFVPPGLLNGNLYMTDQYGWLSGSRRTIHTSTPETARSIMTCIRTSF